MRISASLLVMMGMIGSAAADCQRYLPAVGTIATYRTLFTSDSGHGENTSGQIYRLTTTGWDGATAESTLTPLALIAQCSDSDTSDPCGQLRNYPGVSREGQLITIPVPPEISTGLAKFGKVTERDFLRRKQVFPFVWAQDDKEIDRPQFGTEPGWLNTNALDCDDAGLKGFFPLGAAARATVRCKHTTEVSQSRVEHIKDRISTEEVSFDLSFAGHEYIATPAGDYQVAVIKFKETPISGNGPVADGEWAFAEDLGVTVKFSQRTHSPNSTFTSRSVRELIKVGQ